MAVKYTSNAPAVVRGLVSAMIETIDDVTHDVEEKAKATVKVDSGELRDSIEALPAKVQADGKIRGEVGSYGKHYAAAQEYGKRGKPFLRPSVKSEASIENVARIAKRHWR